MILVVMKWGVGFSFLIANADLSNGRHLGSLWNRPKKVMDIGFNFSLVQKFSIKVKFLKMISIPSVKSTMTWGHIEQNLSSNYCQSCELVVCVRRVLCPRFLTFPKLSMISYAQLWLFCFSKLVCLFTLILALGQSGPRIT